MVAEIDDGVTLERDAFGSRGWLQLHDCGCTGREVFAQSIPQRDPFVRCEVSEHRHRDEPADLIRPQQLAERDGCDGDP